MIYLEREALAAIPLHCCALLVQQWVCRFRRAELLPGLSVQRLLCAPLAGAAAAPAWLQSPGRCRSRCDPTRARGRDRAVCAPVPAPAPARPGASLWLLWGSGLTPAAENQHKQLVFAAAQPWQLWVPP